MATFLPAATARLASAMTIGVLPVPPTVRLPTDSTGALTRVLSISPLSYSALRAVTIRPYSAEKGSSSSRTRNMSAPASGAVRRWKKDGRVVITDPGSRIQGTDGPRDAPVGAERAPEDPRRERRVQPRDGRPGPASRPPHGRCWPEAQARDGLQALLRAVSPPRRALPVRLRARARPRRRPSPEPAKRVQPSRSEPPASAAPGASARPASKPAPQLPARRRA